MLIIIRVTYLFSIGSGSLYMSKSRAEVVSFSTKLDYGTMGIFIKNPDYFYNYFAYIEPLSYWSWVSVTLFLFIFSFILFAMARLVKESFRMSIFASLETVIFAFLFKESPFKPSYLATKILLVRYDFKSKKIM